MDSPPRLAFVHLMRTAGTFVSASLNHALASTHQVHISWFQGLHRDWTREEMQAFAQQKGALLVHNHVASWDQALVQEFQVAGFFVFAFVRDVGDQLCSLYHLAKLRGAKTKHIPLEEFLKAQLTGEACFGITTNDWAIPTYWPKLDFVREFSPETFRQFVTKTLSLSWDASSAWSQPVNQSQNPGYQACCDRGVISRETQYLIQTSPAQQRFLAVRDQTLHAFEEG